VSAQEVTENEWPWVTGVVHLHLENASTSFSFFFPWDWGLNSGLHAGKAGSLPLKPLLQPVLGNFASFLCLYWFHIVFST
jgi:hypothetical protein